jgi:hypothetical protein
LDTDNAGAAFEVRDPLPFPTTPWLTGQGRNEAFKKLTVHWPSVAKFTLAIAVSQVYDREIPVYLPAAVPMREWKIPEGALAEKPKLTAITKDGARLEGFSPDKYSYTVTLPYDVGEKPQYGYYAEEGAEVRVLESANISGQTKFLVKDAASGLYALYTVTSKIEGYIGRLPGAKELPIVSVTASAEPEPENNAQTVIDGVYETRWAAMDDAWLTAELTETADVYAVGLVWYLGDSRSYVYDLEVSEDGENWTQVFSGTSSGKTTEYECLLLGGLKAKYVRYQGHGHLSGAWNNVSEIRVYARG